jgi:hypothetical protein
MYRKILLFSLLFILTNCSSSSNENPPNNQSIVCNCPSGNITANSNDLDGNWKLTKRTILDVTGTTVTEVQDLTTINPCDSNSFHLKVSLDSNNNKVMSIPVGALINPYPHTCSQIVNLEFPIVYYEDGDSCLKLLSTSENAGHKLCLIKFTTTSLKIKMKWSEHYYIFECTKI